MKADWIGSGSSLIPHPSSFPETSSSPRRTGRLTAAVGVVAVGSDRARPSRSVAGDGRGIAFNAQAVTVAAQIAVAEAS